jgi:GTP cyclohydrolase I
LGAQRRAERAVSELLQYIGEDPAREGLLKTPERYVKAFAELTSGYAEDPAEVLNTQFTEPYDEMVVVRGVEFTSLCEHHLLPFRGTATVGYLPGDRIVGLSKLARIVQTFARRLQVQERMTREIADAVTEHVHPRGAGVVVAAQHECMAVRGVKQPNAHMVTSALTGVFRDGQSRDEFLALARQNGHV